MFRLYNLLLPACLILACGTMSVWDNTRPRVYDKIIEPVQVRSIGFVPVYDDVEFENIGAGCLMFDDVYAHFEMILTDLGYTVVPMPQNPSGPDDDIWEGDPPEYWPELTLFVEMQAVMREPEIYEASAGSMGHQLSLANWGDGGSGFDGDRGPIDPNWRPHVCIDELTIICSAWADPPNYERRVWRGEVNDETEHPLTADQLEVLITILLCEGKFQHAVTPKITEEI